MLKIVNRGQKEMQKKRLQKKEKKYSANPRLGYFVSLLNAEFNLFVFMDCRPVILTHSLVKIAKGKYLNTFESGAKQIYPRDSLFFFPNCIFSSFVFLFVFVCLYISKKENGIFGNKYSILISQNLM